VSFEVEAGLVMAVSGPSGSGKSTLLHVVGAMERPDAGTIQCGSFEVSALSAREQVTYRRRIGFVFQRFLLLPALTVIDNVIAPVMPYRVTFDKVARAKELLEAVGLAERADSVPSKLSGGQQQRVAIARALINDPVLLLADEPTGNLDSTTGSEIMDLILELRDERGMTVLVATHDENIGSRSDKVIRMRDGRII
jgi:putative ABC transport system ATP-binding protein